MADTARRPAIGASAVTGYSLRVIDVRDGSILMALPPGKAWPVCPRHAEIHAANPAWPGMLASPGAARQLREEIVLHHGDGRSIFWRESFGEWVGSADHGFINWREIDEPVPTRIRVCGQLDGFGATDQYGAALVLAEDFPDVPGIHGLEQEIVAWSWAYDQAFCRAFDNTPPTGGNWLGKVPLNWRSFNAEGLELARRLKLLLGDRVVISYEKASHDVTDRGGDAWIIE